MKNQIRKILSVLAAGCVALTMISALSVPFALAVNATVNDVIIERNFSQNPLPLTTLTDLPVQITGNGGDDGAAGTLQYLLTDLSFTEHMQVVIYKVDKSKIFNADAVENFFLQSGTQTITVNLGIQIKKLLDKDATGFSNIAPGNVRVGKIQMKTLTPSAKASEIAEIYVQIPPYQPAGGECAAEGESCASKTCCAGACDANKICTTTGPATTGVCETTCNTQFAGLPDKIKTCQEKCCVRGEQNLCNASCDIYFAVPDDQTKCKTACGNLSSSAIITKSTEVESLITAIARWIAILISVVAVIFITLGGVSYVTAGGDAEKAKGARNKIMYGLVGLGVAALAWGAEALVRSVLKLGQ